MRRRRDVGKGEDGMGKEKGERKDKGEYTHHKSDQK